MKVRYTVPSAQSRVGYSTNGSTTVFTVPFVFFDDTDLEVILVHNATGAETTLVLTTNYTVIGGAGATGSLTTVSTYASGYTLVIQREIPYTQEIDYSPNDGFPAEVNEEGLDRNTMQVQQAYRRARQSPILPATFDPENDTPIDMPLPVSGQVLIGKVGNGGWKNVDPADFADLTVPTVITSPALHDELVYNGTSWVNEQSVEKNAKWYGAVGDGITDDTAALQAWYAAGGALVIPAGTYNITGVLQTAVAGTKLRGVGKVTIVTGAAMTTSAIRAWADDCSVENIEIDASASASLSSGIYMAGHRYLVRDVTITGGTYNPRLPKTIPGPYYGIYVGGSSGYAMYTDGVLDNILTTGGNSGIVVQGGKRLHFSKITNFQPAGFGTAVGGGLSVQDFTLSQFTAISCGQYGFSNSSLFGASGIEPRPMGNWMIDGASVKWSGWQSLFGGINGSIGAGKFGFDITDGGLDGLRMQVSATDCCAGGMETKAGYSTGYDVTKTTSAGTASGTTLNFASTSTVYVGMAVSGTNIPADTYIASKTSTTVVLTRSVSGVIAPGASIAFTVGISPSGHKNISIDFHYNSTTATPVHGQHGVLAVLEDSVSDQFFGEKQNIKVFCSTKQAPSWRSDLYKYAWEPVASNGRLWLCLGALADGQPGKTGLTAPSSAGAYVSTVTNGAAFAGTSVLSFASVAGMVAGQAVFGVGVADGTTIASVDGGANDITLSLPLISPGVASGALIICATLESDGALYWLCLGTDYSGSVNNNNLALQINCVSYIYADVVSIGNGYGAYLSSTRAAASNAIDNVNINLRAIGARYGFAMDGVGTITNCTLSNCDITAEIAVYVGGAGGTNNVTISGGKFSGVSAALRLQNGTNNVTLVGDPYFYSGACSFLTTEGTNTLKISSALFEGGANADPTVYFAGTSVSTVWWGATVIDNKNAANQYGGWYVAGTATATAHGGPYRRDLLTNPNTGPKKGQVGEHMVLDTPTATVWGYVCTVADTTWKAKTLA